MDEQQLRQLIAQIALLHQELQKQSKQALDLQQDGIDRLEYRLKDINRLVGNEVSNQLGNVADDFQREIAIGGKKGLDDLSKQLKELKKEQLKELKKEMESFSQFASAAEKKLNHASRSVLVRVGYLSAFALLCVIGSSLWLGVYYGKIINEKRTSVENLEMYQSANIVKCGGQLCAKIQKNTPAEFRKQGYMLIQMK